MRKGEALKLAVAKLPLEVSEKSLRASLEQYGTVKSLKMFGGRAEAELVWNGSMLIDSTGIGEIRVGDRSLPVKRIPS